MIRSSPTSSRPPSPPSQFAFGWWAFLDATVLSAHAKPILDPDTPYDPVPVHVTFADWAPGLCATLGMIIVNLIDKARLMTDDDGYGGGWGGGGVAWRARAFLFVGFALMAGGLAGSIVRRCFCLASPCSTQGLTLCDTARRLCLPSSTSSRITPRTTASRGASPTWSSRVRCRFLRFLVPSVLLTPFSTPVAIMFR